MNLAPLTRRGIFLLAGGAGTLAYHYSSKKHDTLNTQTFVPYAITAREPVSPTSFVFTVSPRGHTPSLPWSIWSQWSVEFKQPQVQIARHYTPLPSESPTESPPDDDDGSLRFYLRAVDGGEMSTYLSRLGVGDSVYLRGPHAGFDMLARLGRRRRVVFLAGGTGVAPGMQVARAVLERGDACVTLLWAVRSRSELQRDSTTPSIPWWRSKWWRANPLELNEEGLQGATPVVAQLQRLKQRYGRRLEIRIAVDDETTGCEALLGELVATASGRAEGGCRLHDQKVLERSPERDDPAEDACPCPDAGKNLLVVSGPEGFVEHYAGPKLWQGGEQLQGPVGGVVARLQQRQLARDWLVLKL